MVVQHDLSDEFFPNVPSPHFITVANPSDRHTAAFPMMYPRSSQREMRTERVSPERVVLAVVTLSPSWLFLGLVGMWRQHPQMDSKEGCARMLSVEEHRCSFFRGLDKRAIFEGVVTITSLF
jgi:hypothetical protein